MGDESQSQSGCSPNQHTWSIICVMDRLRCVTSVRQVANRSMAPGPTFRRLVASKTWSTSAFASPASWVTRRGARRRHQGERARERRSVTPSRPSSGASPLVTMRIPCPRLTPPRTGVNERGVARIPCATAPPGTHLCL